MAAREEKGIWDRMMDAVGSGSAQAAPPADQNAFTNPAAKAAQARSLSYYMRTAEQRPLQDFLDDPSLR